MATRTMTQIPSIVSGYVLDPGEDWLGIVVPEESENLCTNPSFEKDATGWTDDGAGVTIARSLDEQYRGACSLEITPVVGVDSGAYFASITTVTGNNYTLGIDFLGKEGETYQLFVADGAGAAVSGVTEFIASGYWERKFVTYEETAGAARRLYVRYPNAVYATPYYIDGVQFEEKAYPTTYLDGSMTGFVIGETAYYWTGTPHASTSIRIAYTRSGGREIPLSAYGLLLTEIKGLGMTTYSQQELPLSQGGSFYEDSLPEDRDFVLTCTLSEENLRAIQAKRGALIAAVSPKLVPNAQPLLMKYHKYGDGEYRESEVIDIPCVYIDGLQGNITNWNQDNVAITFRAHTPYVTSEGTKAEYVAIEDLSGVILSRIARFSSEVGYPVGVGCDNTVWALAVGIDGRIYLGGEFHNAGGVACSHIAVYNPFDGTFSQVGAGLNAEVYCIDVAPDGMVYIGGNFTAVSGGGIAAYRVIKWNPITSTYSALGDGVNLSVYCVKYGSNGNLYIGGNFTTSHDTLVTFNYIAIVNPITLVWSTLGTGMNAYVRTIEQSLTTGTMYVGGNFTTGNGVAVARAAIWNGTTFSQIGSGLNFVVYSFKVGSDGYLYAGGDFTASGAVTLRYIAKWKLSTGWVPVGAVPSFYSSPRVVAFDNNGILYVGGHKTLGMSSGAYAIAKFVNGIWYSVGDGLDNYVYAITFTSQNDLYAGGVFILTGKEVSAEQSISVNSTKRNYPKIVIPGPCSISAIANNSIDKTISCNNPLIPASEDAILTTEPDNFSFERSSGFDLTNTIQEGSNLDLYLTGGLNNIVISLGNVYEKLNDNGPGGIPRLSHFNYVTGLTLVNTNNWMVYVDIVFDGVDYHVNIYKNIAKAAGDLVAHTADYTQIGAQALIADNASGIGGYIEIAYVGGTDTDITVEFNNHEDITVEWKEHYESIDEAVL